MTKKQSTGKRKWVIANITVSGRGVFPVRIKMPANVVMCKGFRTSIVQPVSNNDIKRIGELSLEFNTRQSHPIHHIVDFFADTTSNKKKNVMLEQEIDNGCICSGYYRNYSNTGYTLRLYLDCKIKTQQ